MHGSALLPCQVPGVHSFVMQLSLVACFQFVDVLLVFSCDGYECAYPQVV